MYILPANKYKIFENIFNKQKNKSSDNIFEKIRKHVKWIDIKFGQFLIFNQTLPHGNIINEENETRMSMNCRFKSVFSPYGSKGIGDFFEPIKLKPITKVAINYELPIIKKWKTTKDIYLAEIVWVLSTPIEFKILWLETFV